RRLGSRSRRDSRGSTSDWGRPDFSSRHCRHSWAPLLRIASFFRGRRRRPASLSERRPNMTSRIIRAPKGNQLRCKGWIQEAALRMLMNNLDPDVAERPEDLIVYGGIGKAARNWESFDKIVSCLENLEDDETLLIQSGKPVGILPTHSNAPRVLLA